MARWERSVDGDRDPGNSSDSPSYSRIYDPASTSEHTNKPEQSQQLLLDSAKYEAQRDLHRAAGRAKSSEQFFPSVGKFIIPKTNSWAAHSALTLDNQQQLDFNPERYVYFDKIIADKLQIRALYDRSHPDFPKYKGLRTNLEVLRNDIIGMYLRDGEFNPGDEKYIPNIVGIATAIGDGLANDVWYKRPFTNYLSRDVANVEAVGARYIYEYLLRRQMNPNLLNGIGIMLGATNTQWDLPPLEQTPYSDRGLSEPLPPAPAPSLSDAEIDALCAKRHMSFTEREQIRRLSTQAQEMAQ